MNIRKAMLITLGVVLGAGILSLTLTGMALAQGMMPPGNTPPAGMPGMMGYNTVPGMMAGQGYTGTVPYPGMGMMGPGMMGYGMGPGMMMSPGFGYGMGMMGMMGSGMMGPGTMMGMMGMAEPELLGLPTLTIPEAQAAVTAYLNTWAPLAGLDPEQLVVGEVMIFDNHAYVQVLEKETGRGAFEVLVDPVTRAVTPEPGPNMMWNLKYSPMAWMMGWSQSETAAEMPIDEETALQIARTYAARVLNGADVAEEATVFYGYYTVDVLRNGRPVGMLSVNGYTGQVFLHHWHGDFVTMTGEE